MPVPTLISELSTTPGSNSPAGSDAPSVIDDHLRTAYAFIRTLSDEKAAIANTVLLTGNQTIAGVKTFSSNIVGNATNVTGIVARANGGTGANYADNAALFAGIKQAATASATGVVELATDAEALTGTDTARAVTPANLKSVLDAAKSEVRVYTANGFGSTATRRRRFSVIERNVGADITYADSSTAGATFTINTNGVYAIAYADAPTTTSTNAITRGGDGTTSALSLSADVALAVIGGLTANRGGTCSWTGYLAAGAVISPQVESATTGAGAISFSIVKVA